MDADVSDLAPGIQDGEDSKGLKRIGRIALGVVLVLAGIAMLVLPGQGILTIVVGLNLIRPDNPIVRWIRKKTPGLPEEGPIPKGAIAMGVVVFIALGVLSFLYGEAVSGWAVDRFRDWT